MPHAKIEPEHIAAFFQALARRARQEPQFAISLAACLDESGLLTLNTERPANRTKRQAPSARPEALDPFAVWRARGEDALRQTLDGLDLAELKSIVRAHRLDPARVSSRWTARDRVIALILDQVKARMNHGRAFERV